jgi:predicted membrane-bound mannosyltransferase/DNA-binding beta-propeller fold protein YncE
MQTTQELPRTTWLDKPLISRLNITWEMVIFTTLLLVAFVTRFYNLDARVMSHDESLHTYFSWKLYQGDGYQHDPMMHGPLQFHLLSWTYFLLGDSDFTARIPAALFGIASIAFLWAYRRYLGTVGVLVATLLFVISPYMLYYSRYVRNESFVVLFGLIGMWAILRYLESGKPRYLLWLTASTALHFVTKETAFIYTAQMLLFLGLLLVVRLVRRKWSNSLYRSLFLAMLVLGVLLLGFAVGQVLFASNTSTASAPTLAQPAVPGQGSSAGQMFQSPLFLTLLPAGLGLAAILLALLFMVRGLGLRFLRQERAFGLIVLLGTFVLPQLSPFPVRFMGWTVPDTPGAILALSASEVLHFVVFLVPLTLIAIGIGLWWNPRQWLINAVLFYVIFTLFYTTNFTNPSGFLSGLVGSLGYWMAQQGVGRGSQPWYYYFLIQVPVYEYLAALGSLIAVVIFTRRQLRASSAPEPVEEEAPADTPPEPEDESNKPTQGGETLAIYLLIFWSVSSLLAYTAAGEKMPWLTVHIALPMILLGGWGIAQLILGIDWKAWRERRGWLTLLATLVFLLSLVGIVASLLSMHPPFRSKELADLQATGRFVSTLLVCGLSVWGLWRLKKAWPAGELLRLGLLVVLGVGALLTARTSFQASYVNYDEANELLVYAHGARGIKDVMDRIYDISQRTTDGMALQFAYDDDTSWPMTWYARNYYNNRYYGNQPGKDLRDVPVIIVGDNNFGKIEPVVGQAYYRFDYIRMVWPNQDYFNLTWKRIFDALTNPEMRAALFQIWLNRDYTLYGEAIGRPISLDKWSPADNMRLYIRKDLAAKLWDYAAAPVTEAVVADPYEGGEAVLTADASIGQVGSEPGQFQAPRALAVAADGSLYVADTDNSRIQHLAPDGSLLQTWGTFADVTVGDAPGGTFNQPWGIAVGPDGSVYIADTWNHRIQKYSPDGQFVSMWGYFGQAETPDAFWGPRDVAVDAQGRVFVTDTGNKRVVVFDADGNYLTQFGEFGLEIGQFDEPVGISIDPAGLVYVADTWNQRIQVFREENGEFIPDHSWEMAAWYGQSLDNKPYITIDEQGRVFVTDPEYPRVIQFDEQGQFVRYWGNQGTGLDGFGLVNGIAVDTQGGVWVVDTGNNRLLHFTVP